MSLDKTTTDLNRRVIDLDKYSVKEVLPGFFPEDYPKLIEFLEAYYEYLEQDDNPAEALNDLFLSRDVPQTKDQFVSVLAEELLLGKPYYEGFEDRRTALEFSSLLYRSKGTRYSIQQFFRIFYNTDVEVTYGKDDMFYVGDPQREVLQYVSEGIISGRSFSYTQVGDIAVRVFDSAQGFSVNLEIDTDYNVNTSDKSIRLLRPKLTNPSYVVDSDLTSSQLSFLDTLSVQGFVPNNATLEITVEKDDSTLIGADIQDKRIQDDKIYQLYSLLITSNLSVDIWREAYKTFAHPAGLYFGNQVSLISSVDISLGQQPTVTADSSSFPVYSLASSSGFTGGYNDVTKLSYDSDGYVTRTSLNRMQPNTLNANGYGEITIEQMDTQYSTMDSAQQGIFVGADREVTDMSNTINTLDQQRYEDSDGYLDSAGSLGLL